MAKAMWDSTYTTDFDNVPDNVQPLKEWAIENHKPLATIALKHMATMYSVGFTDGRMQKSNIDSLGLIQPQKP